jgi:membrane protease subunit (stomatin/prohibitin family)
MGKKSGEASQQDAAQDDQYDESQDQQVDEQDAPPEAASADDKYEQLTKLKDLLDQGILTQAEFDVEKQKILRSM